MGGLLFMSSKENIFDWGNYVKLANTIYKTGENKDHKECLLRTGISRAYYGVYGLCKKVAIEEGLITENKLRNCNNSHNELIDKYIYNYGFDIQHDRELCKLKKDIGYMLKELKDYRVDADYKSVYPLNNKRSLIRDLELAIANCEDIIDYIDEINRKINEEKSS